MKKILLLGGSYQQLTAIETAKRLGYHTILCDYITDNPGQYIADKYYPVSTTEKEAILAIARNEKIDGILAYASDPAAPTAAFVAEKLGLSTNSYKAVETLCNKDIFRDFLSTHNYCVPKSKSFSTGEEAKKNIKEFSFPVIIKPVDSSGSKGVTVIRDLSDIDSVLDFAFLHSRCHRILVEEYVEKKHSYIVGGDIFVLDGKVVIWGLMNCHRDISVNPLVPVGKSYPPVLNESDLQSIEDTLQKLITDLDIKFGPLNVELIIDKQNRVIPIDIGPRSGGNMIPELLGLIFDCDVVGLSISCAMGEKVQIENKYGNAYYATLNLHSNRDGIFERLDISPEIEKYIVRKNIYVKHGDHVKYFADASDALGIVFFKFCDQKTMFEMEEHMNEYIKIVLQGDDII